MQVNELIKSYRMANALTQQEMADKLNMSKQTYARMEKGQTTMTENKVNTFAKLVNKTPREIREMADDGKLFHLLQDNENHDNGTISNLTINNNYYGEKTFNQQIENLNTLLAEKDKLLAAKDEQIALLQELVKSLQK